MEESKRMFNLFVSNMTWVINTAYKARIESAAREADKFIKEQVNKDKKLYHSIYVSNRGYYWPTKVLLPTANNGIFSPYHKWGVSLPKEHPLFMELITLDDEILFIKREFKLLSGKYGQSLYDPVLNLIPNIILSQSHNLDKVLPDRKYVLEERDKPNYKRFCDLLKSNGTLSILLAKESA